MQCPIDFLAIGAMVGLSAVIGRKVGIRPKQQDDWLVVTNLWGAVVGRPGVLKSPALAEVMGPLKRLEEASRLEHKKAHELWMSEKELWELQRKSRNNELLKGSRTAITSLDISTAGLRDEPQPHRYVVNDCTVEALGEILRFNPNGVLAYRDELIGLLKSLDKEKNEGARSFFLSAWNGTDSYTFDRVGRGLNLHIESCCLSLLGGIQPSIIKTYLDEASQNGGHDGLMSRFQLFVWPDVPKEWKNVDRWPNKSAMNLAPPSELGASTEEGKIPYFRFGREAQKQFDEYREKLEARLRDGTLNPVFEAHLSKYRSLVPKLALITHLADNCRGDIGAEQLLKALAWTEYLESHAHRAYFPSSDKAAPAIVSLIAKIRSRELPESFTARAVYTNHWSNLGTTAEAQSALEALVEAGCLQVEEVPTGGRSKSIYRVIESEIR